MFAERALHPGPPPGGTVRKENGMVQEPVPFRWGSSGLRFSQTSAPSTPSPAYPPAPVGPSGTCSGLQDHPHVP